MTRFDPSAEGADATGTSGLLDIFDDVEDEPYEEYDESSVRVRANPRGSRPRTKTRPEHENAVTGIVLSVDRGRYSVLVSGDPGSSASATSSDDPAHDVAASADKLRIDHVVTATRARELRRQAIVTGDRVDVVGDLSGTEGSLARIVRLGPRTTLLRRSADDGDQLERAIVANADRMLIVVAAANPEPRTRLVDRYLVAAYDAGLEPILVITKTDLADPASFIESFAGLDLPVVTSDRSQIPVDTLWQALADHVTVAVGHSGVGKSTLVNALVPDADRATGHVNEVTGRGRHTSSSTVALSFQSPYGRGWIIDTPGVRSFGLGHVGPEGILNGFPDLAAVCEECPRGCTHLADSPDCALDEALEAGTLGPSGPARVDSLRRLLSVRSGD